uniref:Uncharacterized protein n=1 Tax=Aegilops tauschii subsp. strangulata TaxID=200361 RepID=A0A453KKP7_AEGTS
MSCPLSEMIVSINKIKLFVGDRNNNPHSDAEICPRKHGGHVLWEELLLHVSRNGDGRRKTKQHTGCRTTAVQGLARQKQTAGQRDKRTSSRARVHARMCAPRTYQGRQAHAALRTSRELWPGQGPDSLISFKAKSEHRPVLGANIISILRSRKHMNMIDHNNC